MKDFVKDKLFVNLARVSFKRARTSYAEGVTQYYIAYMIVLCDLQYLCIVSVCAVTEFPLNPETCRGK